MSKVKDFGDKLSLTFVTNIVDRTLFDQLQEKYILGNEPTRSVVMSVLIMIFGALVAASNDLAFDLHAYFFILCNDAFTASYGVYTKKSLNHKDLGKYGLLFYNSLLR